MPSAVRVRPDVLPVQRMADDRRRIGEPYARYLNHPLVHGVEHGVSPLGLCLGDLIVEPVDVRGDTVAIQELGVQPQHHHRGQSAVDEINHALTSTSCSSDTGRNVAILRIGTLVSV